MFVVRVITVVFFLLVFQTTWVPRIRIGGVGPDLLLAVVFVLTLRRGLMWGVWTGFILGLLLSVEEPATLGTESLGLCLAALAIGKAARSVDKQNPIVLVLLLVIASLITETVRVLWLSISGGGSLPFLWLRWALPSMLYTVILIPLLGWVSARVLRIKGWISSAA